MRALDIERDFGTDVGVVIANLRGVYRTRRALSDFGKPHDGSRINHPRIDRQTARINDFCTRRRRDIRAHCCNLSVGNGNAAVFNHAFGHGDDTRIANHITLSAILRPNLHSHQNKPATQYQSNSE